MRERLVIAAVVAVLLGAAGCGDDDPSGGAAAGGATATTTTSTTSTTAGPGPASEDAEPAGGLALATTSLGEVVVDGDGRTVYLFLTDEGGESTCYDRCEANWPPLAEAAGVDGGLDPGLLGTTTRTDGTVQATYGGWPLYHFAGDTAPGDVSGHGVNGVWYAIDPAGEAIGVATDPAASAPSY